jgi:hypothetical protein
MGAGDIATLQETVKADAVATTFREATKLCLAAASALAEPVKIVPNMPAAAKTEAPAA